MVKVLISRKVPARIINMSTRQRNARLQGLGVNLTNVKRAGITHPHNLAVLLYFLTAERDERFTVSSRALDASGVISLNRFHPVSAEITFPFSGVKLTYKVEAVEGNAAKIHCRLFAEVDQEELTIFETERNMPEYRPPKPKPVQGFWPKRPKL